MDDLSFNIEKECSAADSFDLRYYEIGRKSGFFLSEDVSSKFLVQQRITWIQMVWIVFYTSSLF